jgi:methionyl-tRNA formyltransferase
MTGHRIVFMGTPDFAVPCLRAIVAAGYEICGVVSQPDRPKGRGRKLSPSPVKAAALEMGLPVVTVERVKDPAFLLRMQEWAPDVAVVVAFGQILPESVLQSPRLGCINVHASLLPAYRGAAPIHRVIIDGEKQTGVTTMQMDRGMDTGDMLLSRVVEILPDMTMGELHDILCQNGAELIVQTLEQLFADKAAPIPQDSSQASYAPMLDRALERIDWTQPAQRIHNLVRGMNPWPGAYCKCDNITMKIWKTRIKSAKGPLVPGRIHESTADGLVVETGEGMIELLEVQPECKRRMGARDCACGYCMTPGTVLE